MADNTAPTNATPQNTAIDASTEKTAQVFPANPSNYDVMNGQEAKAASVVSSMKVQATNAETYESGLGGSENVAKGIVDSTRTADAKAATYEGLNSSAEDLNNITSAAGQPMGKSGAPMANLTGGANVPMSGLAAHTLSKPAAGKTETIEVSSGEVISTTFDPNSADLSMQGQNLVMSFNNGGTIVLENFAQDINNLPTIALPNGSLVAGGVIVAQLQGLSNDIFSLETAAGASGETGTFVYNDYLGDVIGLLTKLPPLPFSALQFSQPEPRVFVADDDIVGGDFFPGFETVDGEISIAGGFEDWQPNQDDAGSIPNPEQNFGGTGVLPMALNIVFVPSDNEVVDKVTISNIPNDVRFFYRDGNGNVVEKTVTNGSLTLSGNELRNGDIFVLPPKNSSTDLPMTISMTIRDPDTNQTLIITKNVVAVVDAVADRPEDLDTSTVSVGLNTIGNGGTSTSNEIDNHNVNLNIKVNFNDNDGSETHTVIIKGIPAEWTLLDKDGVSFDDGVLQPDGTMTYTATVTGNVNSTISFDPNEWTSQDNGDAHIKVIARADENVTDGELDLNNNTSQTEVNFDIRINEDLPEIITPGANAPAKEIQEHTLHDGVQGNENVGGVITVDFKSDAPGTLEFNNKPGDANNVIDKLTAMDLKSQGESITYTISADGKTITAVDAGGNDVFKIEIGALQQVGNSTQYTASYTYTLYQPLDHAPGQGNNAINLPFNFIATDSDGDKAEGSFQVKVIDDVPTVMSAEHTIDETNGVNAVLNGNVGLDLHADGAGSLLLTNFNASGSVTSGGLKSGGVPVVVTLVGNTYVGKAGDKEVFTLQLNSNGTYTFTQKAALDHANAGNPDDIIKLTFNFEAKDFDGDSATGSITIDVKDDGPSAGPIIRETDETNGVDAVLSGALPGVSLGNDGAGSITENNIFSASGSVTAGGLKSGGSPVSVTLENGQYVGKTANGTVVFTLDIKADGTYTFTQKAPLDHADGTNANDIINLNFGYTVTDRDGDTASNTVTVKIVDDAPVAYDDHNSVPDGTTVATGNVITGVNGGPGAADDLSNDVTNVLKDVSANGITKSFETPDGVDAGGKYVLIDGDYGQLKIYENGEYTYTYDAANHGPGHDRFDLPDYALEFPMLNETSNVEINLTPEQIQTYVNTANAMQIDFPTQVTVELVKSSGFVAGYNNSLGAFTLGDNGTISNVDILFGNATANNTNPLTGSDLTATYDMTSNSGRVVFFIIQNGLAQLQALGLADAQGRATDPAGSLSLEKQADGTLKLIYTDSQGHQTEVNATIYASEQSFNGDGQAHTIAGIAPGTDEGVQFGFEDLTGNANNGSDRDFNDVMFHVTVADRYTPGGEMDDVFTYTLVDSDGDTSQAILDFNIKDNGPGAPGPFVNIVDETTDINVAISDTISVPGATQYALGSPSGAAPFSATGSLEGGTLKSNGVAVTVTFVNGQYIGKAGNVEVFTMKMNPNGTYTFTQKAPLDHANGLDANDIINLKFAYTARDADGDAVANTITIQVKDDAPLAIADTNNVPDGGTTATGNVVTNDTLSKDVVNLLKDASFGGTTKSFANADGTEGGVKFVLINGAYGQLKIFQNGNYTYTLNANNVGNHTEQFKYTLADKDGDTSQTTLTLNIVDNGPGTAPAVEKTIDETTDIGASINGTLTVPGATQFAAGSPNGAATFSSNGSQLGGSLKSNGVAVAVTLVNGQYVGKAGNVEVFTLKVNADGTYTFVQKAPLDHANGSDANDVINLAFTYTARDADGDAVSNTITIHVRDDAPLAIADTNSVPDGGTTATGNVVTNDTLSKDVVNLLKDASFGGTTKSFATPDGTEGGIKFVVINGAYGQLKIFENGNYTYTLNNGNSGSHTEQFKYTLMDKDGDTSQTTLTLNIVDNGPGTPPAIDRTIDETTDIGVSIGGTITVPGATTYAAGGPNGTIAFSSSGSQLGGSLKSNGAAVTVTLVNGQYVGKTAAGTEVFTLKVNADGTYTFVQKAPIDHADGNNANDVINLNFTYTASDADGDTVSNTITVHVRDDAPLAIADTNSVPDGAVSANGNVINNDTLSKDIVNLLKDASFGGTTKSFATPDGTEGGVKFVLVNGTYGQLKIFENGQYTYTVNNGNSGSHTEQFKYTLVDIDGDTSQTTLTLNIVDNGPGEAPCVINIVDETTDIGLSVSDTIVVAGATQFDVGSPSGGTAFSSGGSLAGGSLKSNGVPVVVTIENGQYVGKANGVQVFTLALNDNGQYTFVLKGPLDHADGANPNDIINLNFTYTARDVDGDAVSNLITISVKDDAPLAVADVNSVPNGAVSANGNVVTNDTLSKDVSNLLKDASFGGTTKSFATPDGTENGIKFVLVNGTYGQLKIFENGQYTYNLNANNQGNHTEQFKYTLMDKDGDSSQTTLTLNIIDNGPGTAPAVEKTIDETTDINVSFSDTIVVQGATQFGLGTVTGVPAFNATGSVQTGSLKSNGVPVVVTLENGQYVGKANGVQVFTLAINNNGTYTFVLKGQLDHADGNNANDVINLNFAYTARDADGDAVENSITIHVKDDAPVAVADFNTLVDTNVATGNVISNDTLSKDVVNLLKDASFGGTTKSFATDSMTDAGGKYVIFNATHGVLKIYEGGNYNYTLNGNQNPGNGGTLTDQFKYTLVDKDGDVSQTTLTLEATLPKLIVGENVNDVGGSTTPYEVGPGNGVINGSAASDILVGDVGGATIQTQNKDYNMVLILDVSGSMAGNKIALLKEAVKNLMSDFHDYQGGSVKVHIVPFATTTGTVGTFDVTTQAGYDAAIAFIGGNGTGLQAGTGNNQFTNYEAPMQSALSWLSGATSNDPIPGAETFTYFVSDGEPNRYMNGNTVAEGSANTVMGQIGNDQNQSSDGTSEVYMLQQYGEVVGVGIGVDSVTLGRLSIIDSGNDSALDVRNAADLSTALQGVNPINQLSNVGGDNLVGGNGNDLIFGDALNTDVLARAHNLGTAPGAGWNVFAQLEAGNTGWTRADTINYIRTHTEELARESHNSSNQGRTGGDDTITGGDGHDIIFAQEGNDVVNGGAGNDIISGGSGNNTLTGGAGADTFLFLNGSTGHDTITDYSNAQNDKLDISDLLVGSTYNPGMSDVNDYVKIDHATGNVFVDNTGHGTFNGSNMVATINNISSMDTVNVILNDNEGTKIVHTV